MQRIYIILFALFSFIEIGVIHAQVIPAVPRSSKPTSSKQRQQSLVVVKASLSREKKRRALLLHEYMLNSSKIRTIDKKIKTLQGHVVQLAQSSTSHKR